MSTIMTYGDYSFTPVPLMEINVTNQKTQDGSTLGILFNVTLNGTLTPLPAGTAGYVNVDTLQDELVDALSNDGRRLYIACGGSEMLNVYPRINSIIFSQSSDNWVQSSPYRIELEFDSNTSDVPQYIQQATEDWVLEPVLERPYFTSKLSNVSNQYNGQYYALDASPYVFKMTHSVSAVGKSHYSKSREGTGATGTLDRAGWQEARDYVINRLGTDNTFLASSGVINLTVADFQYYNHIRNQTVNELDGSFNVTESWLILNPSGTGVIGNVLEDFTTEVRKNTDSNITTVSIRGNIEGLASNYYGVTTGDFSITQSKYDAAQSGWLIVQQRLLPRAQIVAQDVTTRLLNSGVLTNSVSHNPTNGIISYNYDFNDRPNNCIPGALSENISIVDNNPTDIFASLMVLGRAAGPILQDINTVTAPVRNVNIECVMPIPTGCTVSNLLTNKPTTQVNAILCTFEADLSGNYNQVFLQNDSENWNPKTGQYSRQVTWLYNDCSGAFNTSFC